MRFHSRPPRGFEKPDGTEALIVLCRGELCRATFQADFAYRGLRDIAFAAKRPNADANT
jgi:hypothetical protein